MKIKFLLLSLVLFSVLFRANAFSGEYPKQLKTYNQLINKGVLAANDHHYVKSLRYFKKAFKVYPRGFPTHFRYALQICEIANDHDFGYFCAENMLKYGLCIEFFQQYKILQSDSARWEAFIKRFQASHSIDTQYAGLIDDLKYRDQDLRFYYYSTNLSEAEMDSLHKKKDEADSLHYIEFKELVLKHGFPSADLIGLSCSENLKGINPPQYDILLWHFSSHNVRNQNNVGLNELLSDALNNGNLSNVEFARFTDKTTGGASFRIEPFFKIGDIYYVEKLDGRSLKEVNTRRKEIGLVSYFEQIKLMKYFLRSEEKFFLNFFRVNIVSPDDFPPEIVKKYFIELELY